MKGQIELSELLKETRERKGCPHELAKTKEERYEVWDKICRVTADRCMAERTSGWRLGWTCLDCEYYEDTIENRYQKPKYENPFKILMEESE